MVNKRGRIEMQNLFHDKTCNQQTSTFYVLKWLYFAKCLGGTSLGLSYWAFGGD